MLKINKNHGFSLVELIIVIAIMSILVALLIPQYLKYVERSKISTDEHLAATVHDALVIAITDENIDERPIDGFSPNSQVKLEDIGVTTDKPYVEFVDSIKSFLQVDNLSAIYDKFQSKMYRGQDILVEVNTTTKTIKLTVYKNDGSGALVLE